VIRRGIVLRCTSSESPIALRRLSPAENAFPDSLARRRCRSGDERDVDRHRAVGAAGRRHVLKALDAVELRFHDPRDVRDEGCRVGTRSVTPGRRAAGRHTARRADAVMLFVASTKSTTEPDAKTTAHESAVYAVSPLLIGIDSVTWSTSYERRNRLSFSCIFLIET
jgi:hypothetical protein